MADYPIARESTAHRPWPASPVQYPLDARGRKAGATYTPEPKPSLAERLRSVLASIHGIL